ncbi:DMT family transporter [Nocardioides panacisoli]|uniref:DMT family transporter n=1 Tax=Nocardioides panacisoli TaxID=627624 RepID=UPI001C62DECC|nr:DMT family transporter [Nocardioides panacisoli]QYJ04621.1 DMT family transporter [Nocardioides panacisoli]
MTWAVIFALASATTTALSTATQHRAADAAPRETGVAALMRHLAQRPDWVLALLLGPVGFTLHALALHFGPIALVQPLAITGIVLAVPIRAAWARRWPHAAEMRAVTVTAAAIAVLLLASRPDVGHRPVDGRVLLVAVVGCAAGAVVLLAASGGVRRPTGRAFLLGSAAGILFGLMAVLMAASAEHVAAHGVVSLAPTWLPWALVACGLSGVTINQVAYRTARLSASMPALNVVNCLLALGFGYLVLHETPGHPALAVAGAAVALPAMAWGLWQLSRWDVAATQRRDLQRV